MSLRLIYQDWWDAATTDDRDNASTEAAARIGNRACSQYERDRVLEAVIAEKMAANWPGRTA